MKKLLEITEVPSSSLHKLSPKKEEPTFIYGCPESDHVIPLSLFWPGFGKFYERCDKPPSSKAITSVEKLAEAACQFYTHENDRVEVISLLLQQFISVSWDKKMFCVSQKKSHHAIDGTMPYQTYPFALRECKQVLSKCPISQIISSYAISVKEHLLKEGPKLDTRYPAVLLLHAGMSLR